MIANTTGSEKPEITVAISPALGKAGKVVAVARNGVGELHRDTIDPNSATSRRRFVGDTLRVVFPGKALEDCPAEVREDIDRRLRVFAATPHPALGPAHPAPGGSVAEDPRAAELEEMPADVRAEAEALLCDPKLLERVSADIGALGVVGEKSNRLLLYLVGTSAQLSRPLAVITRGASSSGKSFVGEQVSRLFPPRRCCTPPP